VNFKAIMDNDEDALSEDGGYNSDQSEDQSEETKSKIVYPEKVMTLNVLTKQCTIYFYYTDDSSILCTSCMTRLTDIEHMYTIHKHVIRSHAAIDGKHCSECRSFI